MKSYASVMLVRVTRDANLPLKSYVHQHAWLQYASLSLTAAAAVYSEHSRSASAEVMESATRLYEYAIQTTVDYFTNFTQRDLPLGV